jgi:hypothetical protein
VTKEGGRGTLRRLRAAVIVGEVEEFVSSLEIDGCRFSPLTRTADPEMDGLMYYNKY